MLTVGELRRAAPADPLAPEWAALRALRPASGREAYRAALELPLSLRVPGANAPPLAVVGPQSAAAFALHCALTCRGAPQLIAGVVLPGTSARAEFPLYPFRAGTWQPGPPAAAAASDVHQWTAELGALLRELHARRVVAAAVDRLRLPGLVAEAGGLSPLYAAVPWLARGAWAVLPLDGPPLARADWLGALQALFEGVQVCADRGEGLIACWGFRGWRAQLTAPFLAAVVAGAVRPPAACCTAPAPAPPRPLPQCDPLPAAPSPLRLGLERARAAHLASARPPRC